MGTREGERGAKEDWASRHPRNIRLIRVHNAVISKTDSPCWCCQDAKMFVRKNKTFALFIFPPDYILQFTIDLNRLMASSGAIVKRSKFAESTEGDVTPLKWQD